MWGIVPVREGVWAFEALGALAVEHDGVAVEVGGGRQRRLLAILLIHRGTVVSADRAAEAVFAGEPTAGAATTLRSYVSRLRKVLPVVEGTDGGSVVATVPGGWVLSIPDDWFDVAGFERGVARGRGLLDGGDAAAAVGVLRSALERWRGLPYAEFADEDWAMGEVQRLEELRRTAMESLMDAELASGRASGVVADLEGLVGEFPLAEGFRRRLMTALYRCGRQADALGVFQDYRGVLVDELGLEPSPELVELERQILEHDPALAAEAAGVSVRGYRLGERLGRGRDGVVYAATQPDLDRDLAIRVYDAALADEVGFVAHFEDQARRLASVDHEAVVAIHDWWREPAAAYLVMDRLTGGSLRNRLEGARLDESECAQLVRRVGGAIAAAEEMGVGHGRLGIDSVLFDDDGTAVVTDFVLGRTDPEASGSDVAGLAGIVVACLTGRHRIDSTVTASLPATIQELVAAGLDPTTASGLEVGDYAMSLHTALTGAAAAPVEGSTGNPFKGLRAFDETDAATFFGRERVVDEMMARLGRHDTAGRLVFVVGASGSGKSSVVRAGLLPKLRAGAVVGSDGWLVTTMLPGAAPFKELAEALRLVAVHPYDGLVDELAADDSGIANVLDLILPVGAELVLVIDQLEELFTLTHRNERQRFLDAVVHAVTNPDGRLRVVTTLRADFYDRPLEHSRLGTFVHEATVTVPAMTATELHTAVTGPADRAELTIEAGLVAELVAAVIDEPAGLPALQFVLYELTEAATDAFLTLDDYQTLGGVDGAIAARAEQLYLALDDADRTIVRRSFEHLVALSDEAEPTRRRALHADLVRHGGADVIETWVQARLLTVARDPETRAPTVEVAHEALLGRWPRLRDWLVEDRDAITALAQLRDATRTWTDHGRNSDLLYRGIRLDHAHTAATSRPDTITPTEQQFLDASTAERETVEREQAERVARQARTNRRLKALLATVAVALVAVLVAALVAVDQRNTADEATTEAETQRELADQAAADAAANASQAAASASDADTARMIATVDAIAEDNQRVALLLATEAYRRDPSAVGLGSLLGALTARPAFLGYVGEENATARGAIVALGSDGQIVIGDTETGVEIHDPTGSTPLRFIEGALPSRAEGGRRHTRLAAASDRPLIATRSETDVDVYDIETGELVSTITPPEPPIGVWYSPAGELLIATSAGGLTAYGPGSDPVFQIPDDRRVVDLAFSHDGATLVTTSSADGGMFRIWDYAARTRLPDPEPKLFPRELVGGSQPQLVPPTSIAFGPDDSYLAAGYTNGHVVIWDTATWRIHRYEQTGDQAVLLDPASVIADVDIIATDPLRVVAMGLSDFAHWNLSEGIESAILRDPSTPTATFESEVRPTMAMNRQNGLLVIGGAQVELWSTDDRGLIAAPLGDPAHGFVSITNEGGAILTQSASPGRLDEIWQRDLVTGEQTLVIEDALWGATLIADESIIITAHPADDVSRSWLRQWDATTLEEIATPIDIPGGLQHRDVSPDGRYLAIGYGGRFDGQIVIGGGSTDRYVEIYEITDTGLTRTAEITEFRDMLPGIIEAVVFSPDSRWLLTDGGDVTAEWSVPDGELLRGPSDIDEAEAAQSIDGWPMARGPGEQLYTWRTSPSTISLLDPQTFAPVGAPFLGAEGSQSRAVFSPDGSLMFTGGFNTIGGDVSLWDVDQRAQIGPPLPNRAVEDASEIGVRPVVLPVSSPLGSRLVTTTPNQLLAWNLDFETWPAIACDAAGRNLTVDEWDRFGPDEPYRVTCDEWPSLADTSTS